MFWNAASSAYVFEDVSAQAAFRVLHAGLATVGTARDPSGGPPCTPHSAMRSPIILLYMTALNNKRVFLKQLEEMQSNPIKIPTIDYTVENVEYKQD